MKSAEVYTKNQIEKLGNTLIFLCNQIAPITPLSKTHLLKLIFIIEELSIKKSGIPFFDLRFDVWKLGPVAKDIYVDLSDEPQLLSEYISKECKGGNIFIVAKKEFSDDEFSDNELALLNEICERFKYCTSGELVNFTHRRNTPWYKTALKNGILELLESGKMTTSEIQIDMSEMIEDDKDKLALYLSHKDFMQQSKNFKF